jgi:uncharacterized protein YjbI with pentapeptide repeats
LGLAIAAVLVAYCLAALRAPAMLLPPDSRTPATSQPMTEAERATAIHNARVLAVSFGGALVVLIGLTYTARNYRLAHRGQVTNRFTKALERFDSDQLNLQDLHLQSVYLAGAQLRNANLAGAQLQGAYLFDAQRQRADLRGANADGADLHGADLHGISTDEATVIPSLPETTASN